MGGQRQDWTQQDDGRAIADMGDVRRPSLLHALPHRRPEAPRPRRDVGDELQDDEERLMVVLGTLKAALSLGMVYIVGFGLAIMAMVLLWT